MHKIYQGKHFWKLINIWDNLCTGPTGFGEGDCVIAFLKYHPEGEQDTDLFLVLPQVGPAPLLPLFIMIAVPLQFTEFLSPMLNLPATYPSKGKGGDWQHLQCFGYGNSQRIKINGFRDKEVIKASQPHLQ